MKRRKFLIRCGKTAAAFLLPRRLRQSPDSKYRLQPHYREQTSIDTARLQIEPGHDAFVNELHCERFTAILDGWGRMLLRSPINVQLPLNAHFAGASWKPIDFQPLRTQSQTLDVRRVRFSDQLLLPADRFSSEVQSSLNIFSALRTVELQITQIAPTSKGFATSVRYELVGTGNRFYREQRSGEWVLDWEENQIVSWKCHDEVRSRSSTPCFIDMGESAFRGNASYSKQLMHGADHWRTILDGASGIDIYGHNGVSVGDIFGGGLDDIYVCQPAGLPNRLYRNRGDGTFEDATELSGLGLLDNTACALIADFNNDGKQDVVVVRSNGPLLFLNQGNGKFRLRSEAFRFAKPPQGTFTGAAAADYNRDGLLDIYFCLYSFYQGADQYNYPTPYFAAENGPPNFMMHNNGDGTFRDVTAQCGLDKNNTRYSFCCGWNDYNKDSWPDLYVVNDFGRKNLYRNNGNSTFEDVAAEVGVEDVGAGMSASWLDVNNDGLDDLYVGNMWTAAGERITRDPLFQKTASATIQALYKKHAMGNSLLRNDGKSGFRDVTLPSHTGLGRWAWSCDGWDFDHDGHTDIYVTNGMISGENRKDLNSYFWRQVVANSPNEAKPAAEYEQGWKAINEWIRDGYTWSGFERNVLFANNGDGTFADVSGALGLDFPEDGRAFALADFDGDGRQELLLKNRNAPQIRLMKNMIPNLPPVITFRLTGTKSNRDAIGAVITVRGQTKTLQAGSGFLSQHSKEVFFGLGGAIGKLEATIRWPSGVTQQLTELQPNHRIWVTEGESPARMEPFKTTKSISNADIAAKDALPKLVETWLLTPVAVPSLKRKPGLLTISGEESLTEDEAAVYNLLFRTLFDYHRDLPFPTSFLFDESGQIVKIYQGEVSEARARQDLANTPYTGDARLAKALPFPGVANTFEFGRNYLSLGSIFFRRGYLEVAGDFFQAAAESAESLYGLGSVYLKQGKNTQAGDCFERAVRLKPGYSETLPNAWNNLGILATRENNTIKAIGYFKTAVSLDQDHFVALENLGNAYRQQKRWDEARATLERALTLKPEDAEANYSLGMVLAQNNDTAGAYEHLQKALQARPVYPEALNNLGILYLRTQRRDDAVAQFEQSIRVAPAFDQAYLNLARVYTIEGSVDKARAVLQALLVQHPNHAAAQQALEQLH